MALRAEYGSIYLNGVFSITAGILPPGLTLTGNKITGVPTTAGSYTFTVGASSAPECPVFQRTFTLVVRWNLPCDDFEITVANFSSPPTSISEDGTIYFRTLHFDSVGYTAISLPPGFSFNHSSGSYQATVHGTPQSAGIQTIILEASTNNGCRDTIRYSWKTYCSDIMIDSIRPAKPKLSYGIIGSNYNQSFHAGYASRNVYIALAEGSLPPGLTLQNDRITGIPTTPGIYNFKLSAISFRAQCELLRQSYYIEVIQPNTLCKTYDAITPTPADVSSHTYYANEYFAITLSASSGGVVDDSAKFKIVSGYLRSGITLNGNVISGISDLGDANLNFTIGAFSRDGCPYFTQEYNLHFLWKNPCDVFDVALINGESGLGVVGEEMWFEMGTNRDWDSVKVWPVSLPAGFRMDTTYSSDDHITIYGHPVNTGDNVFIVAGSAAGGCRDTLVFVHNIKCPYPQMMVPSPQELSYIPVNEPYGQFIGQESPYVISINYENFRVELAGGTLPPGLTLTDTSWVSGYIHGTPTTPGSYTFTVAVNIENCTIQEETYTLAVIEHKPFKPLTLYAECSDDPWYKRWRIHNPNNFNIPVTWKPLYYYNGTPISLVAAAAGDTYFISYVINVPQPSLPGTIQLSWNDGDGTPKSITKSASMQLCDPPSCAFASDVVSVHQGLQKNGYNVNENDSQPYWALNKPDANDQPSIGIQHYSLGFNGFIVLRMSSVINDEPGNDLIVYEYSEGNPTFAQNPERAEVFISRDGIAWVSLGLTSPSPCQGTLDHSFDITGKLPSFQYVKIVDKTDRNARILSGACVPTTAFAFDGLSDGFDLDAVTCAQGSTFARQEAPETTTGSAYILYPNPAKDWLTVDFSNDNLADNKQVEISIRDLSGRDLYKQIHTLEGGTTRCEVTSFKSGMYILHARGVNGASGYYKFMKD